MKIGGGRQIWEGIEGESAERDSWNLGVGSVET